MPARLLCSSTNGDLLQEDLCHTLHLLGLMFLLLCHIFLPFVPSTVLDLYIPVEVLRQGQEQESIQFSSVQSLSRVRLFVRPHELQHARPPCPSPTPGVHPNPRPSKSVMPSSHLILCCPLFLLPPIPPSIRVFSNESALRIRCQSIGVSASA